MKAFLSVQAGEGNAGDLPMDAVLQALKGAGVIRGINVDFLGKFVPRWNQIKKTMENIEVAESPDKPDVGVPGRLEILAESLIQKSTEASGKMDFREKTDIIEVKTGQDLARWHPAKPRKIGIDLLGKEVVPPEPMNTAPVPGSGVELIESASPLYRAQRPGFLRVKSGVVEVGEHYVVEGDVDYSSGNITYLHSVRVAGDVRNGFRLNVGGDLTIDGVVEDSFILCSGDLVILTGCVGSGQGLINIKGNAKIGFTTNQAVKSRRGILIERDSVNSTLYGAKIVQVLGQVVGGSVMAGELVQVGSIGNDAGIRTEIELGKDYFLQETYAAIVGKIEELGAAMARLILTMKRLKDKNGSEGLAPDEAALLFELRMVCDGIEEKLPLLEAKKLDVEECIRQEFFRENLKLKVEKMIHPGTVIKACGEIITINETLTGPRTIVYGDGRLKIF